MRQDRTNAWGGNSPAWRRSRLFSTTLSKAEEKSRIGHLANTEAAITASELCGEVVARD